MSETYPVNIQHRVIPGTPTTARPSKVDVAARIRAILRTHRARRRIELLAHSSHTSDFELETWDFRSRCHRLARTRRSHGAGVPRALLVPPVFVRMDARAHGRVHGGWRTHPPDALVHFGPVAQLAKDHA